MKIKITRQRIRNFFKITIPSLLVIFVLLELFFRTIIPAGHHPYFELYEEKGFVIGKYNHKNGESKRKTIGAFASIKAKWRINNHGWNSAVDYQFNRPDSTIKRIAIIGDSYVEALNVDTDESTSAVLSQKMGKQFEVYSFGVGGSPLSQYLNFCRYVDSLYQPDAYIFVITNNDIDESFPNYGEFRNLLFSQYDGIKFLEHEPEHYPIVQGKFVQLAKKSALVRYLFYNIQIARIARLLRFDFNADKRPQATVNPKEINTTNERAERVAAYMLGEVKETVDNKPVLIVHDADRKSIYKSKPRDEKLFEISNIFDQASDTLGFHFIDLYDAFNNDYKRYGKVFNHSVDYHWNPYGHQIVADTLLKYINTAIYQN